MEDTPSQRYSLTCLRENENSEVASTEPQRAINEDTALEALPSPEYSTIGTLNAAGEVESPTLNKSLAQPRNKNTKKRFFETYKGKAWKGHISLQQELTCSSQ